MSTSNPFAGQTWLGFDLRLPRRRQVVVVLSIVGFVGFVMAHLYAGWTENAPLGEFLLDAMFLPIVGVSYVFGVRGAVASSAVAAALATFLFAGAGLFAVQSYLADVFLFIAVALVVGKSIDRARSIARLNSEQLVQAVEERTSELREVVQELDHDRREHLHRLALAIEFRDGTTADHTARVGELAAQIATKLGFPSDEVELLREAAPLHDVGKLGTPDAILLKPGSLTPEETSEMRKHALAGSTLLGGSRSRVLQMAAEIALTHHEWWDGTGYPRQLVGEAIPLAGRIVAVADVFDALTHERPYKHAMTVAEALAELDALAGRQFDPAVIESLHQLHQRPLHTEQHEPSRRSGTRPEPRSAAGQRAA